MYKIYIKPIKTYIKRIKTYIEPIKTYMKHIIKPVSTRAQSFQGRQQEALDTEYDIEHV